MKSYQEKLAFMAGLFIGFAAGGGLVLLTIWLAK